MRCLGVFIILVYWCHEANVTCPIQIEKWDGTVLNINDTVSRLGGTCSGILGMHALSGCDTVSYLNGKGRVSALKVLNQNNITGLDSELGEMDASKAGLMATATAFYLALYSQKKSNTINYARYDIFRKRKNPPLLKSLPPTESNMALHVKRAHLQVLLWKAADKPDPPSVSITDYGWEVMNMIT